MGKMPGTWATLRSSVARGQERRTTTGRRGITSIESDIFKVPGNSATFNWLRHGGYTLVFYIYPVETHLKLTSNSRESLKLDYIET